MEVRKHVPLKNRFQALIEENEEDMSKISFKNENEAGLHGLLEDEFPHLGEKKNCLRRRMPRGRGQWRPLEINSMEGQNIKPDKTKLTITIDSGAAESVINEEHAPMIKTRPSEGSRRGIEYVNANGATMPNRGEKLMPVKAENGLECSVRMQVTDVKRALLSVAKVCDSGHEVTFRKDGGCITHMETGKTFNFMRADGVYRMEVDVMRDADFRRPE